MKIKRIYGMYFSGTGTTRKIVTRIAERIAEQEKIPVELIDFSTPEARSRQYKFERYECVIFGLPVYAGRIPNLLLPFLSTIFGGGALAVPVILYGNRDYDDALIELRDILEKDEFHTFAAGAFIGEHSFSHTLAAGRPDEEDMVFVDAFARDIAMKWKVLNCMDVRFPMPVKGEKPYRPYYQPKDRNGEAIDIRKVKPKTNENCSGCGWCAEHCPMGAIMPENVSEITGICIKCGACVKGCPNGAKYFDDSGYLYHVQELEYLYSGERKLPDIFL